MYSKSNSSDNIKAATVFFYYDKGDSSWYLFAQNNEDNYEKTKATGRSSVTLDKTNPLCIMPVLVDMNEKKHIAIKRAQLSKTLNITVERSNYIQGYNDLNDQSDNNYHL